MATQAVGTYKINSFWESGRLIFYEKAYGHTTTGNVFILGHDYVQVGDTANDVDFAWKGTTTGTFTLDAAAHTLVMTGLATSTDGLITSTSTTGFRSNPTFVPDADRTNYGLAIGTRASALTVTMGSGADQNFDPMQLRLLIAGANPSNSSTVNASYMLITHSTAMTNMRLKCSDWNIAVSKNVKDVYVYQGEVDFSAASITVGGEAAVMGLVMNAGSSAVTGNLRGLIISMQGSGSYASVIGIELRTTCGDVLGHGLAEGIRISGTPLPVVGIAMGNQTNDNEGPQNAFFFPSIGGADEGPCVASGTATGAVTIKIGSATRFIRFWDTA